MYEGNIIKGKTNGYGVFTIKDQKQMIGYWKDNELHGYAKITIDENSIHEGMYQNFKKNGFGKISNNGQIML